LLVLALSAPELRVDERIHSVLVLALPKDAMPSAPTSAFLEALSSAFLEHTSYDLRSSEQAGLDPQQLADCERTHRLSCWAKAVRAVSPTLSAIVVLGVLPIDKKRDRATLTVVDIEKALSMPAEDAETREDQIYEASPRTQPATVTAEELAKWATAAVKEELAPKLETAPPGRVRLSNVEPGVEVRAEQRAIGVAPASEIELLDVRPGVRKISQPLAGGEALVTVTVVSGETAQAAFVRPDVLSEVDPLPRAVLLWSGGATAATGAAFVVWSIAKSAGRNPQCFAANAELDCRAPPFPTFSGDRGLAILPLGLGLLSGGTAWGLGSLLGNERELPWIELAIGTGIGLASFFVGVAVDPR
jgi:hypothetical protein